MRRREFITLLGGAAAWPLTAGAQERRLRIGIIDDAPIWDHFRQGLRDLGYIDGQNIAIEYRSADGQPDRLATVASDLAGLPVDVIVTSGSAASRAAQQATTAIPIVIRALISMRRHLDSRRPDSSRDRRVWCRPESAIGTPSSVPRR
jgi:putative tryptophan/tyrosine transport system substrate-binding protein